MPLIKRKSQKAFEHNLKAEMEAGKPKSQSLAIAYSVKRRAKKAAGGSVQSGSKDMDMANGGDIKGVHMPLSSNKNRGSSEARAEIKAARAFGNKPLEAKRLHKEKLEELRSMPSPKLKGLAEGGSVASERRPMPEQSFNSAKEISRNRGKKAPHEDQWTDNPTVEQARRPSLVPLKHPKMVPQNVYSVRLRDQEDDLESSAKPGPYGEQPSSQYDEEGAKRQGPELRKSQKSHSTGEMTFAKGGKVDRSEVANKRREERNRRGRVNEVTGSAEKGINLPYRKDEGESMVGANIRSPYHLHTAAKQMHKRTIEEMRSINPKLKGLAKGGKVEESDYDRPMQEAVRHGDELYDEEMDLQSSASPSENEGASYADSHEEEGADRQGPEHEEEAPHSRASRMFRDAEENEDEDMELNPSHGYFSESDSEEQPEEEAEMEHEDSIAAAIMAKKKHGAQESGSEDEDEAEMYAHGGEITDERDHDDILSHESLFPSDSDQADLSRNADEDANEEDHASYHALEKENYSESDGLNDLNYDSDNEIGDSEEADSHDRHDRVSAIRARMRNRQFKQR